MMAPVVDRILGICIAGVPFRNVRHMFNVKLMLCIGVIVALLFRFLNSRRRAWHGHMIPSEVFSLDVRCNSCCHSQACK